MDLPVFTFRELEGYSGATSIHTDMELQLLLSYYLFKLMSRSGIFVVVQAINIDLHS